MKKKPKVKRRKTLAERPNTYKKWCDNHPKRRAAYAFVEAKTGESRGLCQACFDREREAAMRILARRERIKKARARRRSK
jgi:hypothetical protein